MKNIKLQVLLFSFSLVLIITGCNSMTESSIGLNYKPEPAIELNGISQPNTLYIATLQDERTEPERINFEPDADPLILIPFWFYSHSNLNPVIRFSYFQPSLLDVLNKLFTLDIDAAKIFKNVLNTPKGIEQKAFEKKFFSISPKAYKLEITLQKAMWSRNLTSYGLSYPGTLLWALGLPVSYGDVYLTIKAVLYAPGGRKVIAKKVIKESTSCTEWIYDQVNYRPPISEFKLAEIFPKATKELREFIFDSVKKYQVEGKFGNFNSNPAMEKAENSKL